MVWVEATVMDSTHLELSRPLALSRGKTVLIAVAGSAEQDVDRRPWVDASASSLAAAYGDSEPDYNPAMVRETNPDYRA